MFYCTEFESQICSRFLYVTQKGDIKFIRYKMLRNSLILLNSTVLNPHVLIFLLSVFSIFVQPHTLVGEGKFLKQRPKVMSTEIVFVCIQFQCFWFVNSVHCPARDWKQTLCCLSELVYLDRVVRNVFENQTLEPL